MKWALMFFDILKIINFNIGNKNIYILDISYIVHILISISKIKMKNISISIGIIFLLMITITKPKAPMNCSKLELVLS